MIESPASNPATRKTEALDLIEIMENLEHDLARRMRSTCARDAAETAKARVSNLRNLMDAYEQEGISPRGEMPSESL